MSLEGCLAGRCPTALWTDVGGAGLVDALVSTRIAAVREQYGRRALLARLDRERIGEQHAVDSTRAGST